MPTRSRPRRPKSTRSSRPVRPVERLWTRLADLFVGRDSESMATQVVLAPRLLESRRMLDAGAAGLALGLIDTSTVQTGQDFDWLNDAALASDAPTQTSDLSDQPGAPLAVFPNTAPSNLTITPIVAVNEGGTATLQLAFNDPDVGDAHTVEIDWGDGTPLQTVNVTAGSLNVSTTHQYVDDPPGAPTAFAVNVRVIDAAGDDVTGTASATVNNVAPSVFVVKSPDTQENGIGSMLIVWNDPGSADAHTVEIDWGDGSPVQTTVIPAGTQVLSTFHQYLDDNATDSYTATITVSDDDGAIAPAQQVSFGISNVPPSNLQLAPVTMIDENQTATLILTFDDPGSLDVHTVEVDWGDGSALQTLTVPVGDRSFAATHTYADDNATDSYTISVRVLDDDGGATATATTTATVNNVGPSGVILTATPSTQENGIASMLVVWNDPGSLDTHTVEIDWGDGSPLALIPVTPGLNFVTTFHQYLDDNATDSYTVKVRVFDDDGAVSPTAQTTIGVTNVPPSNVQITPVAMVNENGVATLDLTFDDPGSLDTHTVEIDWGDGSAVQTVSVGAAGLRNFSSTHQYLDDNAADSYTITVRVLDDDGGASTPATTTTVTVKNVPPSNVQITPVAILNENQTATLNLTFDDPGTLDTHTVEIDWGDGSAVQTIAVGAAGLRTFSTTHQYLDDNAADSYTISVRVLDDDGDASTPTTTTVTVKNVAPSSVQIDPVVMIDENGVASLTLTFDDPGSLDTHQVAINWGDGTPIQTLDVTPNGSRTFTTTHQYLDDNLADLYTITVNVIDDDGGTSGPVATNVTVKNVAPSNVQLAPVAMIDENQTATLNLTFDDPGTLDTHTVEIDWGDGSAVETLAVGAAGLRAFSATHQYLDDNAADSYTITVRVLDDDGGASSPATATTVDVKNVAPSNVQIDPVVMINEHQTAELNLTFEDPGTLDTHTVEIDWGDGSAIETLAVDAGFRNFTATHQYLDDAAPGAPDGSYTITVRVLDDDGGVSTPATTTAVVVKNVAPSNVVVVPSASVINEGGQTTVNVTFEDPGSLDTHTYSIDWGDGQTTAGAAAGHGFSGTHTYADNGIYTVKVTVTDDDAGVGMGMATITVNNVDPTLNVVGNQTVSEGALLSLTDIGSFTDPGFNNSANTGDPANGGETQETFTYSINWGDGTAVDSGAATVDIVGSPGTPTAGSFNGAHTYADNGVYTVMVTVFDDDGGQHARTFTVTVNNVNPTLTVPANQTVNEGALLSLTDIGAFTDPGFNNPSNTGDPANGGEVEETFTYTITWGDGTAVDSGAATVDQVGSPGTPTAGSFNGSHTFADNGVYTVTVTVFDDDGGQHQRTFTVTVNNVDPTLNVVGNQTVNEGSLLSLTHIGTFTDPGFDNSANTGDPANGGETTETFTFSVDWGDGTTDSTGAATVDQIGSVGTPTSGSFDASHTFADNGIYTVTVTVLDDDGGQHVRTFTVTVNNVDPTLTGTGGLTIEEGDAFTLTDLGVGITDPGFDNLANQGNASNGGEFEETFTGMDVDWGDGTGLQSLAVTDRVSGMVGAPTTAKFTHAAHTYADNGTYTVKVRLQDDDGAVVTRTLTIVVTNVPPALNVPATQTVDEGTVLSLTDIGAFTDPGFNNPANTGDPSNGGEVEETFTYTIDWGDGTTTNAGAATVDLLGSPGTATAGSFNGAHTYADNGTYTVTVTVVDDDLGATTKTFTVVVNNVAPTLNTFPDGKKLQGEEITAEGTTNINFSLHDPGFDNGANQPNLANGAEFYETFTSLVDWGDGTVDAVHAYASPPTGPIRVSVDGGPAVEIPAGGDVNRVLTVVAGQEGLNDAGMPATLYTFQVDWGDGTVDTFQLALKAPVLPGSAGYPASGSNGQTIVVAAERDSGTLGVSTTAAAQLQHTYLGPPDPLHPTADVPIRLTVLDDDGGLDGGANDPDAVILVGNPGIQVINIRIDTSPKVPVLTFPVRTETGVVVAANQIVADSDNEDEIEGSAGESKVTSERVLLLTIINPDGSDGLSFELNQDVLGNLAGLFRNLPDNHYKIYLVQGETQVKRLVIEVFVRDGRLIDPEDDSQGARDKPPTDETTLTPANGQTTPSEADAIEQAIDAAAPVQPAAPAGNDGAMLMPGPGTTSLLRSKATGLASDLQPPVSSLQPSLKPSPYSSTIASVALCLTAAGRSWRNQVDETLAKAKSEDRKKLKTIGHWKGKRKPK
jgi:PKD repeat protein/methionine-rich copper-binding protein CopC